MAKHTVHIIAGPTASGKTAFALNLAQETNGIVINCDSMQIYNGLPILTAQPTAEEKSRAPHRLYGILHPNESCSAGIWREMAAKEIEDAFAAGKNPIICGGTGLYIKALMEGLSPIPPTPKNIRAAAIKKQEELGNPGFYEELGKRDPESAARFHPNHTARLVRAWEVLEATGKTIGDWQRETKNAPPADWQFEIHKIMPEREELYRRCNERFLKMLEHGALEEVKTFAAKIETSEIPTTTPLKKALGFLPLLDYIKSNISLEAAITQSQAQTRQYAKRQTTWFKHQL